ncbi:MAG: CoxG family protein [Chloroflexota bacterium]
MRVEGAYTLPADPQAVWDVILSEEALRECIPGCQSLTAAGEDTYDLELSVGVAAIKGSYSGRVEVVDKEEPTSYRLSIDGKGSKGSVSGTAEFTLSQKKPGETEVSVVADAQISGIFSRVGQRMLGGVARKLMGQFFTCMKKRVQQHAGQKA